MVKFIVLHQRLAAMFRAGWTSSLPFIVVIVGAFSFLLLTINASSANATSQLSASSPFATDEFFASADTYVASGRPNQAPSAPNLKVIWVGNNQTANYDSERGVLKFNIPTAKIPIGSTISSASLFLTMAGFDDDDDTMEVTVRRMLSDQWSEDASWNTVDAIPVENGVSVTVGKALNKEYEWNVQTMVAAWVNQPARGALSLRLDSNRNSGDHERNFWSKDCSNVECNAQQHPRLVIVYATPTATPTASATNTPVATKPPATSTPTITPTPAPSFDIAEIKSKPSGELDEGTEVLYTIAFKSNNVKNFKLTELTIVDVVPQNAELVEDSLEETKDYSVTMSSSIITWTWKTAFANDESGAVSYRVIYKPSVSSAAPAGAAGNQGINAPFLWNDGAIISWIYENKRYSIRSKSICNPELCWDLVLPIIRYEKASVKIGNTSK